MILREGRVYTSYSQLSSFKQCPYKWKLRYIDGIKTEIKSKHLDYGNAVHATLENILEICKLFGGSLSSQWMYDTLDEMIEKYDVQFDSEDEKIEWIHKARVNLEKLSLREGIYELIMREDTEIVGVELPFEIDVEIPENEFTNMYGESLETDTVTIVGFIDLVIKTPEGYIVIDHKSGGTKFDKKKLRTDLQLPIYGEAIYRMFGEYPIEGYYNFTRLDEYQRVIYTDYITPEMNEVMDKRSPKDIYCTPPSEAIMQIRKIFNDMLYSNKEGSPSFLCNYCDFNDTCKFVTYNPKFKGGK